MVNVEVFVAAFSALAAIFAGAFYWILSEFRTVKQDIQAVRNQSLQENRALRDELRQEIRDNTQRILDAIYLPPRPRRHGSAPSTHSASSGLSL